MKLPIESCSIHDVNIYLLEHDMYQDDEKKINNSGSEEDTLVDDYKWKTFYFNAKKSLKVKIGNLNSDGRLLAERFD